MRFLLLLLIVSPSQALNLFSQQRNDSDTYKFTNVKILKATPVKDQNKSNTCWCFSTISMIESEILKNGNPEFDLSEMYIVRHTYNNKADRYIRMHGNINFSGGGEYNDVMDVIRTHGIAPESIYSGLKGREEKPDHSEMDKVLKSYLEGVINAKQPTLSPVWFKGYDKVLDTYLGDVPQKFSFEGQEYTPQSFSQKLGIDLDNYILLTSYTHHPFYEKFILEVPDNWSWEKYYNVPLDELITIIDNALENNFSVVWGGDISEKGFSFSKGIAVVPDFDEKKASSADWDRAQRYPNPEKKITQALRQEQFDNYSTTDDHGMHLIGWAKDQRGNKFYYVKNSWGASGNPYDGYMYISEPYIRLKTMSIMVNKNALPKEIRNKFKDLK